MNHDILMRRLWWLRRADAEAVAAALLVEPIPTTPEEVVARLPTLPDSRVGEIAESFLQKC